MLMEVSRMAMSRDDWEEIDLNPVIVGKSGEGAFAVDARVVCRAPAVSAADAKASESKLLTFSVHCSSVIPLFER